jgi:D-arabinose 1-dehydrogenase-like Zn-dependent alcohol dehydrogenase
MLPMDGVDCTGHEGAGVVAKIGPGVTGWKVGDRVGITPVASTCEKCEYCTGGRE